MTLATTTNRISYAGNGVTTAFSYPYRHLTSADLVVVETDDDTGEETVKTITTHYTHTGVGSATAGYSSATVTFLSAPATGKTITIYRDPALTQGVDLEENDSLPVNEVEKALDKLTMQMQRQNELTAWALKFPETETPSETRLPIESERASKYLGFNSDGEPIATAGTTDATPISSYMATVVDDETAAAARTTLGIDGASGNIAAGDLASAAIGSLINGGITATTAANALTIALKDASGSDASSTSPVKIPFRNSTATTGTPVVRSVTGALSMVVDSGSTLGHISAVNQYIYVYALDNAGTVELAVCGTRVDERSLQTTTAVGTTGVADSKTTLYSTTARTNVPVRLIARLKSNQAVAGTWATAISEIALDPLSRTKQERSQIIVNSGNGVGATNTVVRRFSTTELTMGSAITYADSAANGGTFTINEDGIYAMEFVDVRSGATMVMGMSLNSNQLTTSPHLITAAHRLAICTTPAADQYGHVSSTRFLQAGDVVRCQVAAANVTDATVRFSICKVAD